MRRQLDREQRIAALAARQGGVVARAQLLALGLGAAAIDHRVRTARLHVVHRGVYAVGHRSTGLDGRRWAAVLAVGGGAVLSHASAAAAWDLRRAVGGPQEVSTTARSGRARRDGIRLHRVASLGPHETTTLRRLPITTAARTVLDLAARLGERRIEQVLDRGELLRLLDLRDLRRAVDEHRGRPGTARLAAVLDAYAYVLTRSELEERFLEFCAAHGIPRPVMNGRVSGYEVDAHWPGTTLVVELDSFEHHRVRDTFESDRERDVALALAGRRVARLTWRRLARHPRAAASDLHGLLALCRSS